MASRKLAVMSDKGSYRLDKYFENDLIDIEKCIAQLKATRDEYVRIIKDEMEKKCIKSFESDLVKITYIEPTDRESFDSKKFREDNPDLYDEYVKITPIASSIRIKVKEK